jgi:hypothetical protein
LVRISDNGEPVSHEKVAYNRTPAGMVEGINDSAGQILAWPLDYLYDDVEGHTLSGIM